MTPFRRPGAFRKPWIVRLDEARQGEELQPAHVGQKVSHEAAVAKTRLDRCNRTRRVCHPKRQIVAGGFDLQSGDGEGGGRPPMRADRAAPQTLSRTVRPGGGPTRVNRDRAAGSPPCRSPSPPSTPPPAWRARSAAGRRRTVAAPVPPSGPDRARPRRRGGTAPEGRGSRPSIRARCGPPAPGSPQRASGRATGASPAPRDRGGGRSLAERPPPRPAWPSPPGPRGPHARRSGAAVRHRQRRCAPRTASKGEV